MACTVASSLTFLPEPSSVLSSNPPQKAKTSFSQVVFQDLPDVYSPGSDIYVSYILYNGIKPSSRDWVGLFKIGWKSHRDHITYVWCPEVKSIGNLNSITCTVRFQADTLPRDDQEFYQLCYFSNSVSKGQSTPFQFTFNNKNNVLIEEDDETGIIILKHKSYVLEEQILSHVKEKNLFEDNLASWNKQKDNILIQTSALADDLVDLRNQLQSKESENKDLREHTLKQTMLLKELDESLKRAQATIETITFRLANTRDEVTVLEEKLNQVLGKLTNTERKHFGAVKKLEETIESLDQKIIKYGINQIMVK